MVCNFLSDTNFTQINSSWSLTNCEYLDGYLIGKSKTYSIEQELIIPKAAKLYLSFDYICFDPNIKTIYCGIVTNGVMNTTKRKVRTHKRKRISVVNSVRTEKIKVILTIEAKQASSRIYVDSPLLIDLDREKKSWWPLKILDGMAEYTHGQYHKNLYFEQEISYGNKDFHSPYTKIERGKVGVIATATEKDWFELSHINIKNGSKYLIKLSFTEVNNFGDIYFQYRDYNSKRLGDSQIYMIFEGDSTRKIKLNLECKEMLPYIINLKYITVIELKNQDLSEEEIEQLPFI